jgi:hypothetical protein
LIDRILIRALGIFREPAGELLFDVRIMCLLSRSEPLRGRSARDPLDVQWRGVIHDCSISLQGGVARHLTDILRQRFQSTLRL